MERERARLLADLSLAVIAGAVGVAPETIRIARDDAFGPEADGPAAGLRRVWLWGLAAVLTDDETARASRFALRTVQRSRAAVDSWQEHADADTWAALDAVASMIGEIAVTLSDGVPIFRAVAGCVARDRAELRRQRGASSRARRLRDLPRGRAAAMAL